MALFLALVGPALVFARKKKDPHVQRIYELLFTAVSLKSEPATIPSRDSAQAQFPHRIVTVHATVTNASKQFPCARLRPFLEVTPFEQYHEDWKQSNPGFGELLPGQTVEVDYSFWTREGTSPVALVLKVQEVQAERCRYHSDWGSAWHAQDEARIPVDDLPGPSEKK